MPTYAAHTEVATCDPLPTAAREPLAAARAHLRLPLWRVQAPGCGHMLGSLPCVNQAPHAGYGRGCVHHSGSGVPDRHDYGDDE